LTSQNASLICPAVSRTPSLEPLCSYFSISAPVMWGILVMTGLGLLAAAIAWINADRPRGAVVFVLICGILDLLGLGYLLIAAGPALQSLQEAGYLTVVGFGGGGWIISVGSLVAIIGAVMQLRSE